MTPEHERYLRELGLSDGSPPLKKSKGAKRPQGGKAIMVLKESDLTGVGENIFWRFHDDEVTEGTTVRVKRGFATVARIECANAALAWDAERICAGIRFKREK